MLEITSLSRRRASVKCGIPVRGLSLFLHAPPGTEPASQLEVDTAVEAIAECPLQFPVVYRNHRRAGVRRFPYGIFFEAEEHRIVVTACFHGRRNPGRWQSR